MIFIVMNAVVDPKLSENIVWRRPCMHNVMHKKIRSITKQESRKETESVVIHDEANKQEKQRRKYRTQNRGHSKAIFIFWIIVVYPMHFILNIGFQLSIG